MMVAVERLADVWGPVMLTVVWQAALLAVLVLACEWVLRVRQARVRHTLWWLVLVAPLVLAPARLALERSAATVAVPAPQPVVRAVEFTQSFARPAAPPSAPLVLRGGGPAGPSAVRRPTTSRRFEMPASVALMAAWLVGCAIVGARLLLGHRWLRRLIAASAPASDASARRLLEELRAEAGVRREVGLRMSAELSAPLLYGLRRPVILMPQEWLDCLSPDDLRVVLAHEVAHVKRGDFLENLLQRLAELPLFFHPAAWLAGRRIMLAREELCDAAALRPEVDPRSYALSLLAAAERTRARLALASVGVAEGKFTLLRRVEAIMRGQRVTRTSRVASVAVAALVIVVGVAFAAVEMRSTGGGGGGRAEGRYTWLAEPARSEAVQVLTNMKNVALAVHMFMVDQDGVLPKTNDTAELMEVLRHYVKDQSVFLRPGTDEPAVQFTFEPGVPYSSVAEPATALMAVVDYHPEWRAQAYLDGHVILLPKGEPVAWAADADFMSEALHVQSNMQRLGLAMRSYLLEHAGIFPKADSVDEMLRRLGPYLAPESILIHATIGDPLDVRYLARPSAAVSPANAAETPFAEATCATLPGLRVIAYADGHAENKPSREGGSGGGGWALTAVLVNMEQLALAMRAYLADHNNRFPAATDARGLVGALETYLDPRLLFTRPGTKDEVVVRYVMKPGTTWSSIPGWEAHTVPVFVASYSPEFTVVVDAQMIASIRGTD